jgi:hypothetical protein
MIHAVLERILRLEFAAIRNASELLSPSAIFEEHSLAIVNSSPHDAFLALGRHDTLMSVKDSYSTGWITVRSGETFTTNMNVNVDRGLLVGIYAIGSNGGTWSGDTDMYVLPKGDFHIHGAFSEEPELLQGAGRMQAANVDLVKMTGDFTYRLS